MVTKQITQSDITEAPPRRSGTSRFVRVFFSRKLVIFGFIIILIFVNVNVKYQALKILV